MISNEAMAIEELCVDGSISLGRPGAAATRFFNRMNDIAEYRGLSLVYDKKTAIVSIKGWAEREALFDDHDFHITAHCDGEHVFSGPVADFLKDNRDDPGDLPEVLLRCKETGSADLSEFSGEWHFEKAEQPA